MRNSITILFLLFTQFCFSQINGNSIKVLSYNINTATIFVTEEVWSNQWIDSITVIWNVQSTSNYLDNINIEDNNDTVTLSLPWCESRITRTVFVWYDNVLFTSIGSNMVFIENPIEAEWEITPVLINKYKINVIGDWEICQIRIINLGNNSLYSIIVGFMQNTVLNLQHGNNIVYIPYLLHRWPFAIICTFKKGSCYQSLQQINIQG